MDDVEELAHIERGIRMLRAKRYVNPAAAIERLVERSKALTLSPEKLHWRPIEDAWQYGDERLIVTDGNSVWGGAWWHSGEAAWLDCGGITPTHFMCLPSPPPVQQL